MKENGMEKLRELLNEYKGKTYDYSKLSNLFYRWEYESYEEVTEEKLISKKFWFIEWLVRENKIDLLRLDNRIALSEFNKVERVLMALSISNKPISDLISYLK